MQAGLVLWRVRMGLLALKIQIQEGAMRKERLVLGYRLQSAGVMQALRRQGLGTMQTEALMPGHKVRKLVLVGVEQFLPVEQEGSRWGFDFGLFHKQTAPLQHFVHWLALLVQATYQQVQLQQVEKVVGAKLVPGQEMIGEAPEQRLGGYSNQRSVAELLQKARQDLSY